MKDVTVAVLAGGDSRRFGSDRALREYQGRPLVSHMLDIARKISPTVLVVVSDDEQLEKIRPYIKMGRVVVDPEDSTKSALNEAVTAFEHAETDYTLLLPIDKPLARPNLLKILVEMSPRHGAVVPSWPSGHIEPLHSVYMTEHAYYHGLKVVEQKSFEMRSLLDRLQHVLYVSTEALKQFDANLETFKNLNTLGELKTAEGEHGHK